MADLIEMINADVELTVVRRRNVTSSIRRFCTALGYEIDHANGLGFGARAGPSWSILGAVFRM